MESAVPNLHRIALFLFYFYISVVWFPQADPGCTRVAVLLLLSQYHSPALSNIDATVGLKQDTTRSVFGGTFLDMGRFTG